MRNIIKKGLILLLLSLYPSIHSISQTTSADTLKAISLIFNEHEKLSKENPLLKQQISSLEELNKIYLKSDSLQRVEINLFKEKSANDEKIIKNLKSTQKKIIFGSCAGGIVLFLLGIIL